MSRARRPSRRSAGAATLAGAALLAVLTGCGPSGGPPAGGASPGPAVIKTAAGLDMVYIPEGDFVMGNDDGPVDSKPAHAVHVGGLLMDRTEVTQEAYEKLMKQNPSRRKGPRNPVEQTTWAAAVRFCNARSAQEGLKPCYDLRTWACDFEANGYRLPTEAEWERACRGGTTNAYYFGDRPEKLKLNAWFEGNSEAHPHPVGHWEANPFGLLDMLGNVAEWCNDFYGPKYYRKSPKDNPRGPEEGEKRVLRGGAWSANAETCTVWARQCDEAGFTDVCLTMDSDGFRCVRKAGPGEAGAAGH
jgi:formylglycine-generating enzyme required for sulfatase activity